MTDLTKYLKTIISDLVFQVAMLMAENDALRAKIAELEKAKIDE